MKLTNPNYCATIVKIDKTVPLEGCDNLVGINIFGYNIIAQKDIDLESLHVLFTTESQLGEAYCRENNLFSSSENNKDVRAKGYIGKNRRVRAIKLRGHSSNAMLMPLNSLAYLGRKKFTVGDTFNEIDNVYIATKYELPANIQGTPGNKTKGQTKKYERIDGKHFPEHLSTEQYLRNEHKLKDDDTIIVTQKLHGTSVRLGHVEVKVKPTFLDRLLGRQRTEYDYLAGGRRVIKDLKSDKQFQHYYKTTPGQMDIFNKALAKVKDVLPKDVIIYAEIVGYNGQSPIQKGYTYGEAEGEFSIYVYRVVSINKDGQTFDWSWENVKEYCSINGLKHVPEFNTCRKDCWDLNDGVLDVNYSKTGWAHAIPLPVELVDEGVCIRKEQYPTPYILKLKSPIFYEYETKLLDDGIEIAG